MTSSGPSDQMSFTQELAVQDLSGLHFSLVRKDIYIAVVSDFPRRSDETIRSRGQSSEFSVAVAKRLPDFIAQRQDFPYLDDRLSKMQTIDLNFNYITGIH